MRKNIQEVFDGCVGGWRVSHRSCSTDGLSVFSYHTCLLTWYETRGWVLNVTKYSPTTSQQQTALRALIEERGEGWIEVGALTRGATVQDVKDAIPEQILRTVVGRN